jgi:hypothetical protein
VVAASAVAAVGLHQWKCFGGLSSCSSSSTWASRCLSSWTRWRVYFSRFPSRWPSLASGRCVCMEITCNVWCQNLLYYCRWPMLGFGCTCHVFIFFGGGGGLFQLSLAAGPLSMCEVVSGMVRVHYDACSFLSVCLPGMGSCPTKSESKYVPG